MADIVAATGNAHKVLEMSAILAPAGIRLLSAKDVGGLPEVIEDGASFRENAVKKACAVAAATGRRVVADDSGLEVMALGGAPGVLSARYAGEGGNDGRNLRKLLANLVGVSDRRARFVCVIAVADPAGLIGTAEGEVRGHIIAAPRGTGGFGYDPIFVPEGYAQTFAELPGAVKNGMSHRGSALAAAWRRGCLHRAWWWSSFNRGRDRACALIGVGVWNGQRTNCAVWDWAGRWSRPGS